MRRANIKSVIGFSCGVVIAAVGSVLADGTCCVPHYTWGGGGSPCTGTTVQICEAATTSAETGKGFLDHRNATCTKYLSDENALQAACSPSPGGEWILVGGLSAEVCCFVKAKGLATEITQQNFQIRPCNGAPCSPSQP